MSGLYEALEAEFCPPLDTSLLAALIAELELGGEDPPSFETMASLRTTLQELASHAEQIEQELSHELHTINLSNQSVTSDESYGVTDVFSNDSATVSTTSDSTSLSQHSFSSPLGFLQAALPNIPSTRLKSFLNEAGYLDMDVAVDADMDDIDMESVVEGLLTSEYLRELEERGFYDQTEIVAQDRSTTLKNNDDEIHAVGSRKTTVRTSRKKAKKPSSSATTITIADVRQQHHNRRSLSSNNPNRISSSLPLPDPWIQLSSLSSLLAALLPPHPDTFFKSYFHSPQYGSPSKSLRAALATICRSHYASPEATSDDKSMLFGLFDILRSSSTYDSLNSEQRAGLFSDAQLSLKATQGNVEDALEIVWLLNDLDRDSAFGMMEMGIYHSLPTPSARRPLQVSASEWSSLRPNSAVLGSSMDPSPVLPPPTSKRKSPPSSPSPTVRQSNTTEWQFVSHRKPVHSQTISPHVAFIPAYNMNGPISNQKGISHIQGIRRDYQLRFSRRMADNMRKRDELFKEASKAWKRGNSSGRGGEVALYFAERARQFQELARQEALDEARIMVEFKKMSSPDPHTIDLHGTSISEGITIVKEILEREGCSPSKPLKIITGRGTHSVNGVGVLKPAVKGALARDGWSVDVWDGGLIVRGRANESVRP